jgi:hypothetical protein
VYTFSVVRRGIGAYADAPYVLAYVELAEGPRVMTNIVDCDVDSVRIGQEVELVFHRASAETALPRFRPVAASQGLAAYVAVAADADADVVAAAAPGANA